MIFSRSRRRGATGSRAARSLPGHLPFERLNADLVADLSGGRILPASGRAADADTALHGQSRRGATSPSDRARRRSDHARRRRSRPEAIQDAFEPLTEAREYFYPVETASARSDPGRAEHGGRGSGRRIGRTDSQGAAHLGRDRESRWRPRSRRPSPPCRPPWPSSGPTCWAASSANRPWRWWRPSRSWPGSAAAWPPTKNTWAAGRPSSPGGGSGSRRFCRRFSRTAASSAACHFTLDGGRFPTGNQSKIRWEGAGGTLRSNRSPGCRWTPRGPRASATCPSGWPRHGPGRHADGRVRPLAGPVEPLVRRSAADEPLRFRAGEGSSASSAYFEDTAGLGPGRPIRPRPVSLALPGRSGRERPARPDLSLGPLPRPPAAVDAIDALRCMAASDSRRLRRRRRATDALRAAVDDLARAMHVERLAGRGRTTRRSASRRAWTRPSAERRRGPATTRRRGNGWPCSASIRAVSPGVMKTAWNDAIGRRPTPARVDVPAMGFAWVGARDGRPETIRAETTRPRRPFWRRQPPAAASAAGRGERPAKRVLRGDDRPGDRRDPSDPRLSRLAETGSPCSWPLRSPGTAVEPDGSMSPEEDEPAIRVMAAERIEVETASGRGPDHQPRSARWIGEAIGWPVSSRRCGPGVAVRVLEVDIELAPEREPGPDPWQSYYAVRFAWDDSTAELRRSVNLMSWPTEARGSKRRTSSKSAAQSPNDDSDRRAALSPAVRPRGRWTACWWSAARRRAGFGWASASICPIRSPRRSIFSRLARCTVDSALPPTSDSGWLFHVDAPNVMATGWAAARAATAELVGFRVRLLETEGHATRRCGSGRSADRSRPDKPISWATRSGELDIDDDDPHRSSTNGPGSRSPLGRVRRLVKSDQSESPWTEVTRTRSQARTARHSTRVESQLRTAHTMIITIDGPAGAGKSTVARALADGSDSSISTRARCIGRLPWPGCDEGVDWQRPEAAGRAGRDARHRTGRRSGLARTAKT